MPLLGQPTALAAGLVPPEPLGEPTALAAGVVPPEPNVRARSWRFRLTGHRSVGGIGVRAAGTNPCGLKRPSPDS